MLVVMNAMIVMMFMIVFFYIASVTMLVRMDMGVFMVMRIL
jgi:hypothetical protein